jgi:glycosyltransferase involved in cell wall biosynthesis
MSDKARLLWHSNAPWSCTGYGSQTAIFAPKLAEHYNLNISAFWGLEGNVVPWQGIPVLPGMGSTYGNECISEHVKVSFGESRNGMIVTLMDVWVLDPALWSQFNVASWVPVDHMPAPEPVVDFFTGSGAIPLAMSRFGERMLKDAGLDPIYVPHGIDTSIYKPVKGARDDTGFPKDAFVVGMFAANKGNPSRKCFAEAFEAFKVFHASHNEARLYVHSEVMGRFNGVNMPELIRRLGLDPTTVIFPDQYRAVHMPHKPEFMAKLFSSCDVVLSPSAGEGFGIPVIEAQACGVPVIVSDFSAQPELVGSGWLVEGSSAYTAIGSWQFKPSVADIADCLRKAYRLTDRERKQQAENAREHALKFDADLVFNEHMLPALTEVQARFDARKPMKVAA